MEVAFPAPEVKKIDPFFNAKLGAQSRLPGP
jgi:hypothetical protein